MATKLQILQSYSTRRIRDSWVALGSNTIKQSTKIYNQNMIYKVDVESSPLNGYLLFCKAEYIGNLDWTSANIINSYTGEITFGNKIVSPNFNEVLTASDLNSITEPVDENFIPFQEEYNKTGVVKISDADYELCIRSIGYPYITEDELEYSREDIINLAIKPALERYFKWFPKIRIETTAVSGEEQEVPYPSDAYNVVFFSIQQGSMIGSAYGIQNTLLRYWDEALYSATGLGSTITGNYTGIYPPQTQTSNINSWLSGRTAQQAFVNWSTRWNVHTTHHDDGSKWLAFYSNKGGQAEIHWAVQTLDFNDVKFERRPEVIKLCNAEVKKLFGTLRFQAKSDAPGLIDYTNWIKDADTEIEDVDKIFREIQKSAVALRGSL